MSLPAAPAPQVNGEIAVAATDFQRSPHRNIAKRSFNQKEAPLIQPEISELHDRRGTCHHAALLFLELEVTRAQAL